MREFHKQFYSPKNTTIVVIGMVDDVKLLETLHEFEEKLISRVRSLNLYLKGVTGGRASYKIL